MGWLWNSSKPANPSNEENDLSLNSHDPSSAPTPFPSDPSPPQDHSFAPRSSTSTKPPSFPTNLPTDDVDLEPRTRDQIANDEVLSFFRNLQAEREREAKEEAAQTFDEDNVDEEDDEPPELMTPARLYNSKMKCIELLDAAWHCASPGGQFFNVYRFGTFRQCGQHWADMTVCWKINRTFLNPEKKEQATLHRHWKRERDRLRERGGCSEEVWGEGRRWVVKDAFQADWEDLKSPWRKDRWK